MHIFCGFKLLPTRHLNDVTKDRAILIHSILMGCKIDIGRVIDKAMTQTTQSKRESLWFPSMITAMCKQAGVNWDAIEGLLHLNLPIDLNLILIQPSNSTKGSSSSTHHPLPLDQDTNNCQ
ncbi:Uncharacterized protein TCM_032548 [Theobroma cacao]|uniref:Putative plant transposon protein domain-containing protein n=1 Tax=Theobroma cacao TaxID=3641 RepID=A0A061F938_THECC|nr:Uncharacterized protein TCM_032548 [Theobroma cacao]